MKRLIEKILQMAAKKNLLPKIVSILLAVILWGYLTSTKSGELKLKIPVTYKNLDESLIVSRVSPKSVFVRVKGRKEDLKIVNIKNVKIIVDLARPQVDEYRDYPLQIVKIDVPEDLVMDVNPEEAKLYIEKKVSRNIRIIPRHTGTPEAGLILGRIKATPEYVKVSGPGSILNNMNSVYTEYIYLDKKNTTFKAMARLEKVNLEQIEYGFSDVNVTVPLFAASETAMMEIPVIIKNRKKGYRYELRSERIKVAVIIPQNRDADTLNPVAYIDAAELAVSGDDFLTGNSLEKDAPVRVRFHGLDDWNLLSVTPEIIKVLIIRE